MKDFCLLTQQNYRSIFKEFIPEGSNDQMIKRLNSWKDIAVDAERFNS
jgi:hypothetical protein